MTQHFLSKEAFTQVIDATPLVSIDLIMRNAKGQILLGQRLNKPAQGYWFVPGGRIRKNERLSDAFSRLCATELGLVLSINQAKPLGNYEHFYNDNAMDAEGVSTHYVVLAYEISLNSDLPVALDDQHEDQAWWNEADVLNSAKVHNHTKDYFRP